MTLWILCYMIYLWQCLHPQECILNWVYGQQINYNYSYTRHSCACLTRTALFFSAALLASCEYLNLKWYHSYSFKQCTYLTRKLLGRYLVQFVSNCLRKAAGRTDDPPLLLCLEEKITKLPTFQKFFQGHGPVLVVILRTCIVPNQITSFVYNWHRTIPKTWNEASCSVILQIHPQLVPVHPFLAEASPNAWKWSTRLWHLRIHNTSSFFHITLLLVVSICRAILSSRQNINLLKPSGFLRTTRFNIQKFYMVLALRWVFCTDLRTDSDLSFIRH